MNARRSLAVLGFCVLAGCASDQAPALPVSGGAGSEATPSNRWAADAQSELAQRKALKPNRKRAKNVILFVADGMDPTTVAAARIYDGQSRGDAGEENMLSFERFPYLAMSKTYTTDYQVPDSAGTMSAMVTGVKTRSGALSVSEEVPRGNCPAALQHSVVTLGELSEQAGMATGVVSTARLTHATPAAVYSHSPSRGWEADANMPKGAIDFGCRDIARQLIEFEYGDGLEVAMGGGREKFMPMETADPEDEDVTGDRKDGRDLTAEWSAKSPAHVYVWDKKGFEALSDDARPLALFDRSHMTYEIEREEADVGGEPSLEEMTRKAISILSKNDNGFFLMVEAGRVDHAHHEGLARKALSEAQEYAQAVAAAVEMTDTNETLIVVTADHGHTVTFQGYPARGNDILGLAKSSMAGGGLRAMKARDGKAYTTLSYANGPGSIFQPGVDFSNGRPDPASADLTDINYRQQALIPTGSETHGGQDVGIYAVGPNAYLFSGTVEQNYIFHVIEDALDLRARVQEK
ncbi:MAG: alkaline phosphatase [Pseudomonadota bacterium]